MASHRVLRRVLVIALGALAAMLVPTTAAGDTTTNLKFKVLPTSEGWTYFSDGAPEASIFSVGGGVLTQNTLAGPNTTERYELLGLPNATKNFTIFMRARVLAESGNYGANSFGFGVLAISSTECFGVGIGTSRLEDCNGTTLTNAVDGTVFHDYLLKAEPGVGYELFVDNTLVATGPPRPFSSPDEPPALRFGDLTRSVGANAEVTRLQFHQGN